MLLVLISWVRKVSLFLIDCALIVPILHWVFGLDTMSSEMNMFCRLFLFIPFCLCLCNLSCLDLMGFQLIHSFLIVAMALYGIGLGLGLLPPTGVPNWLMLRAFSSWLE